MKAFTDETIKDLQRRIATYGDENAYKELFFIFFDSLKRFAQSIIKDKEVAEEVVSDVFIEVWKRHKTLENITNLRLYLFVSVRNICLKRLKASGKEKKVSFEDIHIELAAVQYDPEEKVLDKELFLTLTKAVEALPPKTKLVYKLAKEDKLKYKDIAALLGISVKTIDNQLVMALKKIAAQVGLYTKTKR